ncbi:MAG TPA: rod-binding protein [Lacipirellulaceae bacterium]|nr:rod-binding protein [Lacipirellulaceae bacterium]
MTSINHSAAATFQLPVTLPPCGGLSAAGVQSGAKPASDTGFLRNAGSRLTDGKADELRKKFTQFVGEAFYGQMLKAMRSTVGKPAYFYGGRAEEVFQGQLDQKMAEELTKVSASKFAEPMFERQFPNLVAAKPASALEQLNNLRRR